MDYVSYIIDYVYNWIGIIGARRLGLQSNDEIGWIKIIWIWRPDMVEESCGAMTMRTGLRIRADPQGNC